MPPLLFEKGKLSYTPEANGDRIPDFSYCGYMASEKPVPDIPVKVIVPVTKGDATLRIQSALDYVAELPADANGFRGAVLLQKGTYEVFGQLRITASGVVLRGSGVNETTIVGAGTARLALIKVIGKKQDWPQGFSGMKVTDAYLPVNSTSFHISAAEELSEGLNKIIIRRPSTANWINTLGTDHFGGGITALGWKPGDRDLYFDRTITKIEKNTITIDAPITTALDSGFGGASVFFYKWEGTG